MKEKKSIALIIFLVLFVSSFLYLKFFNPQEAQIKLMPKQKKITNFFECLDAGNPAMESYPRQCRSGDKTFTENIGNELEKMDLIVLDQPLPNQKIKSPLVIEGKARGIWFFEGDFPVILTNWDGLIIAEGYASAQGEWMTDDFVKFRTKIKFEKPDLYPQGTLILQKDNVSDKRELDDALEIPVYFD